MRAAKYVLKMNRYMYIYIHNIYIICIEYVIQTQQHCMVSQPRIFFLVSAAVRSLGGTERGKGRPLSFWEDTSRTAIVTSKCSMLENHCCTLIIHYCIITIYYNLLHTYYYYEDLYSAYKCVSEL